MAMSGRPAVLVLAPAVVAALSVLVGAGAAAAGPSAYRAGALARPAAAVGRWGKAIEVPGSAALNKGGYAYVSSVSCASPGNCAAGGPYQDDSGHLQAFVVTQRNGRWRKAIEVPGLAALNRGGYAWVRSVSCAAGGCSAGGYYQDGSGRTQAFVVTRKNGRWGRAIEVPGLAALNKGRDAWVRSVSCAAGGCLAGGFYENVSGWSQAFVVTQRNGRWGRAIEVPGLAALNTGNAEVTSVSCASAGNCTAAGSYADRRGHGQGFVAVERNGRWGKAIEVPGLGALNKGGGAEVSSLSCSAARSCSAGGFYKDSPATLQAFVVTRKNGRWGKAIEVPGLSALNKSGDAMVNSVSCSAGGGCSAGGFYSGSFATVQAFVVTQRNGHWAKAIEVPGTGAPDSAGNAYATVESVSCAAGGCSAGGSYQDGSGRTHAFVVTQRNGRWADAVEVPGTAALNTAGNANARVESVSCATARSCSAGGIYDDSSAKVQAFVVSRT
jgi:hypothetical protein